MKDAQDRGGVRVCCPTADLLEAECAGVLGLGMTDVEKQLPKVRFIDCLHGGKLEPVGIVLCPSHDGCFNTDGAALLGDLQNQIVPFTDFERNVAQQPTPSEGEIDECSFALCIFSKLDWNDKAFERKESTRWSENPRVLAEINDPPILRRGLAHLRRRSVLEAS